MIRIAHVITCLDTGGGNLMLYRLLAHMDRRAFENTVVSLTDEGPVGEKVRALGIPVWAIGMHRGVPDPAAVGHLARRLRRAAPQAIQTWGYHADLAGGLAAKFAGHPPVAWGIHHTTFDPAGTKRLTVWTTRACACLSRVLPEWIVCCSESAAQVHRALGYAPERMSVIPNGFDLSLFRPDPMARRSVRRELGIPAEAPLIGLVARFDPQKDHRNFLEAARLLLVSLPDCHFLLCGRDVTWGNAELAEWTSAAGADTCCHLLGERQDIPRLTAALDVACTASSYGEAFPLVIGEAMATGVPCVVTDVGDSAAIVGQAGMVVPPKNPGALAGAWARILCEMSREERTALGLAGRQRVAQRFSIDATVAQYERLYRRMACVAPIPDTRTRAPTRPIGRRK